MYYEASESTSYLNPCYRLYNCSDLTEIYTGTDLSGFNNGFVKLAEYVDCYYVTSVAPCLSSGAEEVTPIGDDCAGCTLNCYTIGGFGTVSYVAPNSTFQTIQAPVRVCSWIVPRVTGNNYEVINNGPCDPEDGCAPQCYLLTNCETEEEIISNSIGLLTPYAFGQTVTLAGKDGCWEVTLSETCECAIAVTVQIPFPDCITCLPKTAYKLTNCVDSSNIIYSLQANLGTYAGKTVKINCGIEEAACWNVQLIDYTPPSPTQIVTILDSYETCIECTRSYYLLTDCEDEETPVITYTDLSAYLGKVIKINNCPTCWTVTETNLHTNAVAITFAAQFTNCTTCGVIEACTCTRITNYATGVRVYTYIDCANIVQTFSLEPKETKKKFCVGRWITRYPTTDNLEEFGNCVLDGNTKVCPPDPTGREVRPGYNTPSCDPDKYEKITCRASEILYKNVLEKRYGISNCCPEEDDKWLIKKELIDLAALEDSTYPCTVVNPCCAPASCGCSTCNS